MVHCDDYSLWASRKGLLINFGKNKIPMSGSLCTDIVVLMCPLPAQALIFGKRPRYRPFAMERYLGDIHPRTGISTFVPTSTLPNPKLSSSMQILPSDISKRFNLASSVGICTSSETGHANTISEASARPSILGKTALRTPVLHRFIQTGLPLVWVGLALRQWRLRRMLP